MNHRVADGCGYYDGSFRQRQTVINQQVPVYLPEAKMPMYDQGIGRSLWYTNNTDISNIRTKIESFPASRHASLWRGMGIAVAYVGGCDEHTLTTLWEYAATNGIQLARGAALAVRSRMLANTTTKDTDQCSRLWFRLSANAANLFSSDPNIDNEATYFNWVMQMQEGLANSFESGH